MEDAYQSEHATRSTRGGTARLQRSSSAATRQRLFGRKEAQARGAAWPLRLPRPKAAMPGFPDRTTRADRPRRPATTCRPVHACPTRAPLEASPSPHPRSGRRGSEVLGRRRFTMQATVQEHHQSFFSAAVAAPWSEEQLLWTTKRHEIPSPVTAVLGLCDTATASDKEPESTAPGDICRASRQLLRLR